MITVSYKLHENAYARIDSCRNCEVIFIGETMNVMPDASEVNLTFTVEGGAEGTLQDLHDIMGKKRFKKPIEFNVRINDGKVTDEFEFLGSPILYRMPDTSKPETEMTIQVL